MSIIIANNDDKGFFIISDTKVSFNEDKIPFLLKEPLKTNLKRYGILKTIIIGGKIVFGFVGENLNIVDKTVYEIRKFYNINGINSEKIHELVLKNFSHKDNIKDDGFHKCDFILAILEKDKPFIFVYNDKKIYKNITNAYIGNCNVYKQYINFEENCNVTYELSKNNMACEFFVLAKFTPEGDLDQDLNEMHDKMITLKSVVDRGTKSDYKHVSDVDSPIIGVYHNIQRNQFEYFYSIVYETHSVFPMDGKSHEIGIRMPYISGEHYEIIPINHFEGIIIYNKITNIKVRYSLSDVYIKNYEITDFSNLSLPILIS